MDQEEKTNSESLAHALGTFLKTLRATRRMTLRGVEQSAAVSNAYLSQLEQGRIAKPSPQILHKLAACYGIPYEDLLTKAGYMESPVGQSLALAPAKGFKPGSKKLPIAMRGRPSTTLGELSREEEEALLQYLAFLRSREK
jgi:transcriptional regulator with XRE-family HTH domain